jgi:chaperone required for assembly of F1-ATPase
MRPMSESPWDLAARLARASLRRPEIKRFYERAGVGEADGGWALLLDGRGARTPGKNRLVAATRVVAEAIAAEWAGQGAVVDPASMPITRLANSAIDGVANTLEETRADIAGYAGADLLCYRAEAPEALVAMQAAAFDPVLAWAEEALGARFVLSAGVMHVAQPERALAAVRSAVDVYESPFAVAALHGLTSLSGSVLLALAVARAAISADAAWRAAHVDEDFQIRQWSEDAEAMQRRAARWREFEAAARVIAAA